MNEDTPTIQNLPRIERTAEGHLTEDSRCEAAIMGMPPSEVSKAMEAYENLYQRWKEAPTTRAAGFQLPASIVMRCAAPPVRILRAALADLALAHAKALNDARAQVQNSDTAAQFRQLHGDQKALRSFLFTHFGEDLDRAESLNRPLLDISMEIMLRAKGVPK